MRAQDKEAHHFRPVFLQHFADGEKVAQRFRHFFVINPDKPVMHPVIDEFAVVRTFGLRNLVLMMWKLQILTTAVDVEVFAEVMRTHGRTLDMPARPALAPG